jgi:hypothetical protein
VDLAVDAGFAHAPRDELGHLAAEVDDEDGVGKRCALGHCERIDESDRTINPARTVIDMFASMSVSLVRRTACP